MHDVRPEYYGVFFFEKSWIVLTILQAWSFVFQYLKVLFIIKKFIMEAKLSLNFSMSTIFSSAVLNILFEMQHKMQTYT